MLVRDGRVGEAGRASSTSNGMLPAPVAAIDSFVWGGGHAVGPAWADRALGLSWPL